MVVCIYVGYNCMDACMYKCTYACMCKCTDSCIYKCTDACMYECTYACIYKCTVVCMYRCIYVQMYRCIYVQMYRCTNAYNVVCKCINVCMRVCTDTHICTYLLTCAQNIHGVCDCVSVGGFTRWSGIERRSAAPSSTGIAPSSQLDPWIKQSRSGTQQTVFHNHFLFTDRRQTVYLVSDAHSYKLKKTSLPRLISL